MVPVKNWPFFHVSYLGNIGQENVFYDILEEKNAFLRYKNKKFKKSKNWHFSKGVNPWFWSKNGHFSNLIFLGNIGKENVFYDIVERKNAFLGYKNKKFKKSKNWHFTKGVNPWFWSKNGHFSSFFFLGNIGKENVFFDVRERKNANVGYKNKKFKKSKNWHFSNLFFLGNIVQENVFYDILERKNAFLRNKNKKLKKAKNCHFSKGVNPWFPSKKWPFFQLVFFRQYRQGKCLLRYFRTKKCDSRL